MLCNNGSCCRHVACKWKCISDEAHIPAVLWSRFLTHHSPLFVAPRNQTKMDSPESTHNMEKRTASELRKGDLVFIKNRACRISETPNHFKNGKHGKAKVGGVATDIFDSSKTNLRFEFSAKDSVWVPVESKTEYLVVGINNEGDLTLMNSESCETRHDISLTDNDVGTQVREFLDQDEQVLVTVHSCIGRNVVVACKKDAD
jgi:translation elongation factor P/translation initiation factor 5A